MSFAHPWELHRIPIRPVWAIQITLGNFTRHAELRSTCDQSGKKMHYQRCNLDNQLHAEARCWKYSVHLSGCNCPVLSHAMLPSSIFTTKKRSPCPGKKHYWVISTPGRKNHISSGRVLRVGVSDASKPDLKDEALGDPHFPLFSQSGRRKNFQST